MARWAQVLEDLESDLDLMESQDVPTAPPSPWTGPGDLGPLPPELAARAQGLQERQAALIHRLDQAMAETRRQVRLNRDLRQGAPSVPVYLDTEG